MHGMLDWLSRQSFPRFVGLLLGNTRELELRIVALEADNLYLRNRLELWQDKWLQAQGFSGVESKTPEITTVTPELMPDDEEMRRRDEEAEIEERAETASRDPEYMEHARDMAEVDPRWQKVVRLAEQNMEIFE